MFSNALRTLSCTTYVRMYVHMHVNCTHGHVGIVFTCMWVFHCIGCSDKDFITIICTCSLGRLMIRGSE